MYASMSIATYPSRSSNGIIKPYSPPAIASVYSQIGRANASAKFGSRTGSTEFPTGDESRLSLRRAWPRRTFIRRKGALEFTSDGYRQSLERKAAALPAWFHAEHRAELQSEYFVPFDNGYDAIESLSRIAELISPLLLVSEVRPLPRTRFG